VKTRWKYSDQHKENVMLAPGWSPQHGPIASHGHSLSEDFVKIIYQLSEKSSITDCVGTVVPAWSRYVLPIASCQPNTTSWRKILGRYPLVLDIQCRGTLL
jgi:hypothetical protein